MRAHLQQYLGPSDFAGVIRGSIDKIYDSMEGALTMGKKLFTTSDDLSQKMEKVLPEIYKLGQMLGRDSIMMAWKLLLRAADLVFVEESCGYGSRGFDIPADPLLEHLAPLRKAIDPRWNWEDDVRSMKKVKKHADDFGAGDDYFVRTLKLMSSWSGQRLEDVVVVDSESDWEEKTPSLPDYPDVRGATESEEDGMDSDSDSY